MTLNYRLMEMTTRVSSAHANTRHRLHHGHQTYFPAVIVAKGIAVPELANMDDAILQN